MYTENNNYILINTTGANDTYKTSVPKNCDSENASSSVTSNYSTHGDPNTIDENRRFGNVNNDVVINMNDGGWGLHRPTNLTCEEECSCRKMQYVDETTLSDETTSSYDGCTRIIINEYMRAIKIIFYFKYRKDEKYLLSYLSEALSVFDANMQEMLKEDRKSNCTTCQFCFFVALFNCLGYAMPPTPSPCPSPRITGVSIKKETVNRPTSSPSLTKEQYDSLYRDFKHASQMELRELISSKKENNRQAYLVDKEMQELIHPFMSEFFTILVEEYLKSFEEMGNGLTLLRETGITLEEICPFKEEKHSDCCKNTFLDQKLASGQPYNATDFEKMLRNELRRSISERPKSNRRVSVESDDSYFSKGKPNCYCNQEPTKNNPYMTFLTEMSSHTPFFYSTEEFDQIFQTEKKGFLKDCLKLLRGYERFLSESEDQGAIFKNEVPKSNPQLAYPEIYNMSVQIYNLSICHVQSVTLAFFKSMKYGGLGGNLVIPMKPDSTSDIERNVKINESKHIIEKSLTEYLMPNDTQSPVDNCFKEALLNRYNAEKQDSGTAKEYLKFNDIDTRFQAIVSLKYENEVKSPSESKRVKHKLNIKLHTLSDPYIDKEFPPLQRESLQEHPDLDYGNATCLRYREHGITKRVSLNSTLGTAAMSDLPYQNTQGLQSEDNSNRSLDKMKVNNARVTCVLNYYKPEVSHLEAIAFLKKLDAEKGILHNPHCSETTFLKKIEGPSFHLSVCCVDCRQELAPPQKVEAFKCEPTSSHPSKFMAYIMRKSRASLYFPVQCGSCGYFLCDPEHEKKRHLLVPFHSLVKGFMYPLRLGHHKCDVGPPKEYIGCLSDTMNTIIDVSPLVTNSFSSPPYLKLMGPKTNIDQDRKIFNNGNKKKKLNLNIESQRGHSFEHPNSTKKCLARSNSVPELPRKDRFFEVNNNQISYRKIASLKFEEAVTTLLNIWTYEMIDFEKGMDSVDFRLKTLNHRKKLSIFIKQDIIDKTYCRHILSVFKRIEDFKSPILEFKDRHSKQAKVPIYAKIIKRSQSCISKLSIDNNVTPKSKSLNFEDFSVRLNMFNQKLSELENEAKRGTVNILKGNSQLENKTATAYTSVEHDFRRKKIRQQKWLDTRYRDGRQYLQTKTQNRKNIARPLSLHSELDPQRPIASRRRRRRSLSFADEPMTKSDVASQINAWKKELLDLQKCVQSPRPDCVSQIVCRKNIARPLSLYSELKKKLPATHRSRSCSFVTDPAYKDNFSSQLNEWKHKLLDLQRSVESPYLKHKTQTPTTVTTRKLNVRTTQRPKSDPVINEGALSLYINEWDRNADCPSLRAQPLPPKKITKVSLPSEYQHKATVTHPKSKGAISPNNKSSLGSRKDKLAMLNRRDTINSGYKNEGALPLDQKHRQRHRLSDLDIKEEFNSELDAWKRELLNLQKSVESPLKYETHITLNPVTISLDSEPELRTSVIQHKKLDSDYSVAELKIWNHKLRQLEDDAKSPNIKSKMSNSKIRTRAASLHAEPKHAKAVTKIRPKSESVLDHTSELKNWKQQLHILEEEAKDSPLEISNQLRNLKITPKNNSLDSKLECDNNDFVKASNRARKYTWIDSTVSVPMASNDQLGISAVESQYKPHILSTAPRQLPPIPDRKNRRHSHYDTTGNFIPLLTERKETRLNTHDC